MFGWYINSKEDISLEYTKLGRKRKTQPRFVVRKRSRNDSDIIVTFVLMSNKHFKSKICILVPLFVTYILIKIKWIIPLVLKKISYENGKDNNTHYPTNRTKHESRQYIALLILNVQTQFLHVSEPLSEIYKYIYTYILVK